MQPREKRLLTDLAWLPVVAGNFAATYLVFRFLREQIAAADSSPVGALAGVEVLILWAAAELAFVAVLAVVAIHRHNAGR